MVRGIYVLEYIKGVKEAFIYAFSMPEEQIKISERLGYTREQTDSFNGWKTGNTISRKTIEDLLNKK